MCADKGNSKAFTESLVAETLVVAFDELDSGGPVKT